MIGFWPANAVGDDIRLYTGESRSETLATFHGLRQQLSKRDGKPEHLPVRFRRAGRERQAPIMSAASSSRPGIEEVRIAERFERANDDYRSILVKALADRFAEAFAERMHERVRKEFWGYAPDETFTTEDLIGEEYQGIRPAPGYPAQPDHTEKATLFSLLEAERRIGVTLTETFAMWPGSSVSGLYLVASGRLLFRRRQGRARSGRGLCRAQGHERRRRSSAGSRRSSTTIRHAIG